MVKAVERLYFMKCKIAGVIILIIMLNSIILSGCSKVNKGNTNKSEPGNMSSDALPLESTKNTTENEKQSTSRNCCPLIQNSEN